MALISLQNINMAFGGPHVLDGCTLNIEEGERICLLGRNGAGKSTFFKIINGDLTPDSGIVIKKKELVTSRLSQKVPEKIDGTIFDVVVSSLNDRSKLLIEYNKLNEAISENVNDKLLNKLEDMQHQMETQKVWHIQNEVETVLTKLKLPSNKKFNDLSGGIKRRVLLAKALVGKPDVLLLDEPTNHLDIDSILWLEDYLKNNVKTLVFVTHDREFLKNLANRIIELDRGHLTSWECDYPQFLTRKEDMLKAEEVQNIKFDKKLSNEEDWLRKGIRARRTRNEGRVTALEKLREEKASRKNTVGNVKLEANSSEKSGKLVLEAENICFNYGELKIVENFSIRIIRGDRIGIIGPNGCGKTTLLNLLLGKLEPKKGKVTHGTNLEIIYFDQLRSQLDENKSVQDNIACGNNVVEINGKGYHIVTYLKNFLFSPEQARTQLSALSGGERNRLLLAKLFTRPSNVLVFDEPTNDLDIETLELLEELLFEYKGTVLIVSHDRKFLNNVVTSTITIESEGNLNELTGSYDDIKKKKKLPKENKLNNTKNLIKEKEKPVKLTYKEKRELEIIPGQIEDLEEQHGEIINTLSDPLFFKSDPKKGKELQEKLNEIDENLKKLYQRWEELDQICDL